MQLDNFFFSEMEIVWNPNNWVQLSANQTQLTNFFFKSNISRLSIMGPLSFLTKSDVRYSFLKKEKYKLKSPIYYG